MGWDGIAQSDDLNVGTKKIFYLIHDLKGGIYYSEDSTSFYTFQKAAEYIKSHPDWVFEVGVHSDFRGSTNLNLNLSKHQASNSCFVFHKQFGIESERLIPKGYGENKPLIPEDEINKMQTEEEKEDAHRKNKRYEIIALKKYVP